MLFLFQILVVAFLSSVLLYTKQKVSLNIETESPLEFVESLPVARRKSSISFQQFQNTSRCKETRNIFYLKVHKTGSTTVSNLLYKFGIMRNLSFSYAEKNERLSDFIGHPQDLLRHTYRQHKFNIIATHTILDVDEIYSLMPSDTKIVATLRHPFSRFQSSMVFYGASQKVSAMYNISVYDTNKILDAYLSNLDMFPDKQEKILSAYALRIFSCLSGNISRFDRYASSILLVS